MHISAGQKLRNALSAGTIAIPGVFNALTAKMAERCGFQAVYQSGGALSTGLAGVPDIGLLSQTEFCDQARYLVQSVQVPVISDADTGFGGPLAVEHTVRNYEMAGLAGLHLEDQESPKRCGHLTGKRIISVQDMAAKIRAAVGGRRDSSFVIIARTDAFALEGMSGTVERAKRYLDAGADMIFPEALVTQDDFEQFAKQVSAPLIANMTEFGMGTLLSLTELSEMGYAACLFPVTIFRVAMKAAQNALIQLSAEGTQARFLNVMQTRQELYELINYSQYDSRENEYVGNE